MPNPATAKTPLKAFIEERGLRQNWIAQRVGIDEATLSRIVNGMHPGEDRAARIAEVLGADVEELFPPAVTS